MALPYRLGTFVTALSLSAMAAANPETALLDIDPENFDNPTIVDNKWMPLEPGTQLVYEGSTVDEDGEKAEHSIIFTVTDLVKVINGIPTVVIWDRDFSEGRLEESELTFFAQDNDGNVWHLGQYSETYDEMEFVGGQAWLVGHLEGAKAGIMMKADPKVGAPSYSQGFAPAPFNWTDRARTVKLDAKVSVPAGNFDNVLVSEEFDAEEPGAVQLKYYAPGVGNVQVGWSGKDESQEELALVEIKQLTPEQMEEVRASALELEDRNYIYGRTLPIEAERKPRKTPPAPAKLERNITDEQAKKIALEAVPGQAVDVAIERKLGDKRLVVEVIAADDQAETDVIIDRMTGEVLKIEK